MKQGSHISIPIYFILGLLLVFTPFTNLSAQDEEDDSVEEIFWGDEEEDEGLDEEFDFDEELGDEDYLDNSLAKIRLSKKIIINIPPIIKIFSLT